eukprot:1364178-Prymnesium_polylepis.1
MHIRWACCQPQDRTIPGTNHHATCAHTSQSTFRGASAIRFGSATQLSTSRDWSTDEYPWFGSGSRAMCMRPRAPLRN